MTNELVDTALRLSRAGRHEDALAALSRAAAQSPNDFEARFYRGSLLSRLKRTDEALPELTEAIRLRPDSALGYMERGAAQVALGRPDLALADYEQAVACPDAEPSVLGNIGICLVSLNRLEEALEAFTQAIAADPGDPGAYNERAKVLHALGESAAAVADLDEAIRLNRTAGEFYSNRAAAKSQLGDKQGALADADRAIELTPDAGGGHTWAARARIHYQLGDPAAALADWTEAIRCDPPDPHAYAFRAQAEMDLGRTTEALADLDAYLARASSSDPYRADAQRRRDGLASQVAPPVTPPPAPVAPARKLHWERDAIGIVVALDAGIDEAARVSEFIVREGDTRWPDALRREPAERCDVALVLEFLSEVSFDGKFLTRSVFEAQATPRQVGGTLARVLPVQAMRIGRGTLLRAGSRSVFVSRAPDEELPSALVQGLLESAGEAAPR